MDQIAKNQKSVDSTWFFKSKIEKRKLRFTQVVIVNLLKREKNVKLKFRSHKTLVSHSNAGSHRNIPTGIIRYRQPQEYR